MAENHIRGYAESLAWAARLAATALTSYDFARPSAARSSANGAADNGTPYLLRTSRIWRTISSMPFDEVTASRSASVGEYFATPVWSISCQIGRMPFLPDVVS